MQQLTPEGRQIVDGVAYRHGFSSAAVTEMLGAVAIGHGNQAQFNHYEFGGMGQWSSGGMVMIGDMFNNGLKARVSSLCQELSGLIQGQPLFVMPNSSQSQSQGGGWQGQGGGYGQQQSSGGVSGTSLFVGGGYNNWWPADLGAAGSTGAQNNLRYAYFPAARRLAIDVNGQVSVYETGDHQIGGFSQQQSGDQSLTFTSQFGLVRVLDLPLVSGPGQMGQQQRPCSRRRCSPCSPRRWHRPPLQRRRAITPRKGTQPRRAARLRRLATRLTCPRTRFSPRSRSSQPCTPRAFLRTANSGRRRLSCCSGCKAGVCKAGARAAVAVGAIRRLSHRPSRRRHSGVRCSPRPRP